MNNNIQIELINETARFESLREQWDALLRKSPQQSVFFTWEWLSAWWKHFGSDKELWLLAAWDADELVGLVPLMRITKQKYGLSFRTLKPLSTPECDISGFIVQGNDLAIVNIFCQYILSRRKEWDVIQLSEFKLDHPQTQSIISRFAEASFPIYLSRSEHFYIPIQDDWDTFYKKLSKNIRHNIKRRRRRAQEIGEIKHRRVQGQEITWEHFETIFKINKTGNFPDLYESSQDQAFHRELMQRMKERDWIELNFLSLGDQNAAFQYGFNFENRYEDWRGGFNLQYAELSLGNLLTLSVLEDHFKRGAEEFDFLRGIHDYKTKLNPFVREFIEIRVANRFSVAAILGFVWLPTIGRSIKKIASGLKTKDESALQENPENTDSA